MEDDSADFLSPWFIPVLGLVWVQQRCRPRASQRAVFLITQNT